MRWTDQGQRSTHKALFWKVSTLKFTCNKPIHITNFNCTHPLQQASHARTIRCLFTKSPEVVDHGEPCDNKFQNVFLILRWCDMLFPFLLDEVRQETDQTHTFILPIKVLRRNLQTSEKRKAHVILDILEPFIKANWQSLNIMLPVSTDHTRAQQWKWLYNMTLTLSSPKLTLSDRAGIAKLVKHLTEKAGAIMIRVKVPSAAKDFLSLSTPSADSYGIHTAAVCNLMHWSTSDLFTH